MEGVAIGGALKSVPASVSQGWRMTPGFIGTS